jgi:hypothetical protein
MEQRRKQTLQTLAVGTTWTLLYWFIGLAILGVLMLGDCIDVEACERSKHAIFKIGMMIEVVLYAALMALFLRSRRR